MREDEELKSFVARRDLATLNGYLGQVTRYYMPYIQGACELGYIESAKGFEGEMKEIVENIHQQIKREEALLSNLLTK